MLTGLFAVPALVAAGAALVLMRRVRSIAGALRAMVVVALGGTALVVAGAASVMVVDGHDVRVVLLALGLGSAVGLVAAGWIGERLAADLGRLAATARRIGHGELDARTDIERSGEVGELVAGPGFDPSFRARATAVSTRFDEARTRSGGGAGLGLPIARGLVEAHGGWLRVHPQPGGRVTVQLPR